MVKNIISNKKNDIRHISLKDIDTLMILSALMFITLPVFIFLIKFTRPYIAVIGSILFICFIVNVLSLKNRFLVKGFSNRELISIHTLKFFLITILLFVVWLYFSGIGSFSFQNWDHWVRNPIYNDMINKSWPIYYNLGMQAESVRNLAGGEWVAFAYYFTYWLTPATLCKLFGFIGGGLASRIILFLYTLVGLVIIEYLLMRLFHRFSHVITIILMTFSGLDVVAYLYQNHRLPGLTQELEWSLLHYQLSGNTTQLYYVFNQSIPIWIIMLLLLNISLPALTAAISAICFAYSPWATIGLVPIAVYDIFSTKTNIIPEENAAKNEYHFVNKLKSCISILNIAIPLFILVVFGLFYTASSGSQGGKGLYFFTTEATPLEYIIGFVVFVLTEFGLYYIAMGRKCLSYKYSLIVFIELLLFPLFYVVDFNFFIRGTIPALFLLMIIIISFLYDGTGNKQADASKVNGSNADSFSDNVKTLKSLSIQKKVLICLLIIGALNSTTAFSRSVINTAAGGDYLQSDIVTFDDMSNANDYQILTVNSQFFVHGFASKPFYMFISKIGL